MAFVFLCSVMAQNDSTQTIVHAIKDNVHPDTRMVVVILPTNRKDRYDAIKTYCCVENPGMQLSASSVVPVQRACILEWLPQACDKSPHNSQHQTRNCTIICTWQAKGVRASRHHVQGTWFIYPVLPL